MLITSGGHALAGMLADHLSGSYEVLQTSRNTIESEHPFRQCDLDHEEPTDQLVAGIDAIVHVGEPLPDDDMHEQIDYLTRRTYNLLLAAANAGVRKVVYLSTLEIMTAYDSEFLVNETWRPRPDLKGRILYRSISANSPAGNLRESANCRSSLCGSGMWFRLPRSRAIRWP